MKRDGFTVKTCAHCGKEFSPSRMGQKICFAYKCVMGNLKAEKAKDRADTKARREKLKRIPDLIREAQHEFNAFVRERDRHSGFGCISSGRILDWSGNGVDAGHYRSVGSAPHLRFDERNCHAQSKHDNQYKSGNAVDYRLGLIERIGIEAVEALEAENSIHKWQRDELIAIRKLYRDKVKEIKQ